jgi:predicted PP-loop superfamily ATPase
MKSLKREDINQKELQSSEKNIKIAVGNSGGLSSSKGKNAPRYLILNISN